MNFFIKHYCITLQLFNLTCSNFVRRIFSGYDDGTVIIERNLFLKILQLNTVSLLNMGHEEFRAVYKKGNIPIGNAFSYAKLRPIYRNIYKMGFKQSKLNDLLVSDVSSIVFRRSVATTFASRSK